MPDPTKEDPAKRDRWVEFITQTTVTLAAVAVLIAFCMGVMFISVSNLSHEIQKLSTGDSPTAVERKQNQAEERFILCSRSTKVIDAIHVKDLAVVCEGYESLAAAYKTQDVPAP